MRIVRNSISLLLSFVIAMSVIVCPALSKESLALESTGNSTFDAFINDGRFTNGVSWGGGQTPKIASYQGWGCCAYTADFVKYCFGTNNPRSGSAFYSASEIRAGDVITVGNPSDGNGHWFVVLKRNGNSLYVAEGSYDNRVRIGWNYSVNGNAISGISYSFNTGYHYLDPHTHEYNDISVITAPTATSTGTWRFKCSCGATKTQTIPALNDANIKDGVYKIASKADTSMYVSVAPSQGKKEGNIVLYKRGGADQSFTFTRNSDGTYAIKYGSSLCVDVHAGDFKGNVQLYTPNGTNAQKWYVVPSGNGYYKLVCKATYFCMNVYGNHTDNNTNIWTYQCDGTNAEEFKLELVECSTHSWNSGVVTKQPGIGTTGTRTYTCTDCGKTRTESIPALISIDNVTINVSNQTYTGSAINPSVTVKDGTKTLKADTDYTLSYSNNTAVGTATVTITGKGNYSGTRTTTFNIVAANASGFVVNKIGDQDYTGSAITPAVTVKFGSKTMVKDKDYVIVYSDNTNPGTATITIVGTGNFTGTKVVTFNIVGKAPEPQPAAKFTWKKSSGKWYYVDQNGNKTTGFATIDGSVYYFNSKGIMLTGWQQVDGVWYYFASSGVMKTGWQKISKKWYYFNDAGMMLTGVQTIAGKTYGFDTSGKMLTGWQKLDGIWYYFLSGGDAVTGWKKISKKWYWFYSDGSMASSETIRIGNKDYKFNSSGVCTNP